jgi:hypothetical protein
MITPVESILIWCAGPANGGGGTAGTLYGVPQWHDGETVIAIIETVSGREFVTLKVHADGDHFSFKDTTTGKDFGAWSDSEFAWWAKLTSFNTPPEITE